MLWRYHLCRMQTGRPPAPSPEAGAVSAPERRRVAKRLFGQLHQKDDSSEPARIGAAYRLASIGDSALAVRLLGEALYNETESVRRAATYGLVAVGADATETFLTAMASPVKWVRKAGVYGLGDASYLNDEVLRWNYWRRIRRSMCAPSPPDLSAAWAGERSPPESA